MFSGCIAIFLSFGLVHSIPTNYIEPLLSPSANVNENTIPNAKSSDAVQETEGKRLDNRNAEDSQVSNYHNVIRLSDSEVSDVIFDTPVHTSCNQGGVEGVLAMDYNLLKQDKLSLCLDQYPQSAQESNQVYEEQEPVKISMDIDVNNYDDDDNELPNPILSLDSLSNIYSTYIQETIPVFEARENNDIDVLRGENNEVQLPNMRPNRSEDDEYARIIAELEHDAMMNNIIPTMSIARGAVKYEAQPALQAAIFPTRTSNDCGLPILLACQPSLSNGVLMNSNSEQMPPVAMEVSY